MGGIAKSVGKLAKGLVGGAGGLVGGLLGGVTSLLGMERPKIPELPAPPVVEPPTPMPTPNDAARRAAQRKSAATQRLRQGRASTILTTNIDDSGLGG